MTDESGERSAHEERLLQLGAAESKDARRQAGLAKGRATIGAAMDLYRSMGSDVAAVQLEVRRIALAALPRAIARTAQVAMGKIKAPESVRLDATRLLAGAANVSIEAIPGASSKPVAEMTLAEIDEMLRALSERSRDAQAIESSPVLLPNDGSASGAEAAPGEARPAAVSAHPPAGGSNDEG